MSGTKPIQLHTDTTTLRKTRHNSFAVPLNTTFSSNSSTNNSPTHSSRILMRPGSTTYDSSIINSINNNNHVTYNDVDDKTALELLVSAQQQNDLLQCFAAPELEILVSSDLLKFISVNESDVVTSKGEAATFIGVILSGVFTVNVTDTIKSELLPSMIFGETAYFEQSLRTADVVCSSSGVVCICQFDDLINLLIDGHNTIYTKFITMLGNASLRRVRSMIPKNATLDPLSQSVLERAQDESITENSSSSKPAGSVAHDHIKQHDRQKETLLLGRLKKTADVAAEELRREKIAHKKAVQQKNQNIYYIQHLESSKIKLEHEIKDHITKYNELNVQYELIKKKLMKSENYLQPFLDANDMERKQWKLRSERYDNEIVQLQHTVDTLKQNIQEAVTVSDVKYSTLHTELQARTQQYTTRLCVAQWQNCIRQTIYQHRFNSLVQQLHELAEREGTARQSQHNAEIILTNNMSRMIDEKQQLQSMQHTLNNDIIRLNSTINEMKSKCDLHVHELESVRRDKELADTVFIRERAQLINEIQSYENKAYNKSVQINISSNLVKYFTIRNFVKHWKLRNNLTDIYFRLLDMYQHRVQLMQSHSYSTAKPNITSIIIKSNNQSVLQPGDIVHTGKLYSDGTTPPNKLIQRIEIKRLPMNVLIDRLDQLTIDIYDMDEKLNYELIELRNSNNAFFQRNIELTNIHQQLKSLNHSAPHHPHPLNTNSNNEYNHTVNHNKPIRSTTPDTTLQSPTPPKTADPASTTKFNRSLLTSQQIRQLPYIRPNTQQSKSNNNYQYPPSTPYIQQFMSPNNKSSHSLNDTTNTYTLHNTCKLPPGVNVYPNTSILVIPGRSQTQPIPMNIID